MVSLTDSAFQDFLVTTIVDNALPASQLCFEITETAAIENFQLAGEFLETLRDLGCKFALDDFGSGVASFAYLRDLDVDYLKIDGSFVRDCAHDDVARAMVRSINDIGHVMGKLTVAEFAENENVVRELETIGVDSVQGFAIHQPAPLDEYFASPD